MLIDFKKSCHATAPFLRAHFKLASPCDKRGSMGSVQDTLTSAPDLQSVYMNCCNMYPTDKTVILVGSQRVEGASELFYAPVSVGGQSNLRGMLDSGSMS